MSRVLTDLEAAAVMMSKLMLKELLANQRKGNRAGWLALDPMALTLEVFHHAAKLHHAVIKYEKEKLLINLREVQEFAADTANMAMMVLDRCGGLLPPGTAGQLGPNTEWVTQAVKDIK